MLIAFNKPYEVLSQFSVEMPRQRTLAEFGFPRHVYPLGRLDADSEGLLLLTDEAGLNRELLHPDRQHRRLYWVQVEGIPSPTDLERLQRGVTIQGRKTLPCQASFLEPRPDVPPRTPPIRFRKNVPDRWIALELVEGKNRQVRRMTAAIGYPTLRLIRVRIGQLSLGRMPPGSWRVLSDSERGQVLQ